MPACDVATSHSFIVAFSYIAASYSLAGRSLFLSLMLIIFLNAETLFLFVALVLLLVQVEKSCCACMVACAG